MIKPKTEICIWDIEIINAKQPYLPICSVISNCFALTLFSYAVFDVKALMIFGIIIIAIIISP